MLAPHTLADLSALTFMTAVEGEAFGAKTLIARSGYTGDDGFEISLPPQTAADAWATLSADSRVTPVGLGARDTLRLEAGLCLYGQDLTEEISPVEAGLAFVIGKRRRREGGFLGEGRILQELRDGPARCRVGLSVEGRVPVRAGATVRADGQTVGTVTSGGVAPTLGVPIAMAMVDRRVSDLGTTLEAMVRERPVPVTVTALPFVPPAMKRKGTP